MILTDVLELRLNNTNTASSTTLSSTSSRSNLVMSERQTLPPEIKSKQRAAPPEKMVPKGKPETPDIPGSQRDSPRNPRRETEIQDWLQISRNLKDTLFNAFKSTIISQKGT